MRYFIIKRKDSYKPQIVLPYSIKEQLDITSGKIDEIDRVAVWKVKESDFTFYSDILTEPTLLLSSRARNILQLYDAKMAFKQIILFGRETETVMQYYLPLLPDINGNQKEKNQVRISRKDGAILKKAPIVKLRIKKNQYFLASMELVESFLKNRLSGIDITAVDVVWDEEILVYEKHMR